MTIDELWEKHTACGAESGYMIYEEFKQAMIEYGEHLKAEAVKVCEAEYTCEGIAQRCAAAIERMEIK